MIARTPGIRGMLSLVDQAIVSGTSFVTSVIIGRTCSQGDLGVYYLALSVVLLAIAVQGRLVSAPYVIYRNRYRGDALAAYSGSTLVHQIVISALTVASLLVFMVVLSLRAGHVGLVPVMMVLLGAAPFLLLREYICQFVFAHLQPATATMLDGTVAVLQIGSLLLLAHFDLLSVAAVYAVMGGACAVACLGWFWAKTQPLRIDRRRIRADWLHNWSFGKWALAGKLLGETTPYIIPWIVAAVHGTAVTGVLAICVTLVGFSNLFVSGLSNYLTPRAAKAYAQAGSEELLRVLRKFALLFVTALSALCLLYFALGETLAVFIYGDEYAGVRLIITVLGLDLLVSSVGLTAGTGLWAIDRPQANLFGDACTLVITLVAAFCLVYPLAALGAAVAMLAGSVAGVAVRWLTLMWLIGRLRHEAAPARG
jgi:O-antigen/teichoic acid export membrane protein